MNERFDMMIGRLDRILSEMVAEGKSTMLTYDAGESNITSINRQTLKHHAEDMILAGHKILKDIGCEEDQAPFLEVRISRDRFKEIDDKAIIREMKARGLCYPPVDGSVMGGWVVRLDPVTMHYKSLTSEELLEEVRKRMGFQWIKSMEDHQTQTAKGVQNFDQHQASQPDPSPRDFEVFDRAWAAFERRQSLIAKDWKDCFRAFFIEVIKQS